MQKSSIPYAVRRSDGKMLFINKHGVPCFNDCAVSTFVYGVATFICFCLSMVPHFGRYSVVRV